MANATNTQQICSGVLRGGMVESNAVMKKEAQNGSGAPAREFLVVEARGEAAEALRAELASRGFAVSVHRAGSADAAASAADAAGSVGGEDADMSEESIDVLVRNLSPTEFRVLSILFGHAGRPVHRMTIYRKLYEGRGPVDSRAVDQILLRLKDKLGPLWENVENRPGVGVLWNPDGAKPSASAARRFFRKIMQNRAAVLLLLLVAGFSAGWLLRSGTRGPASGAPGTHSVTSASLLVPPPPPPVRAGPLSPEMAVAPGHGPECMVDGDTNTWFQSAGPARKKDGVIVEYHPALRGTLSVQCGVPGSTNAPPAIRIGVITAGAPRGRRLGYVDPETGFFSCDIGEKPASRVVVVVAADSDEPFAVQSVRIDP